MLTLIIVGGLKMLIRAATVEYDATHCEIAGVRVRFMILLGVCTGNHSHVIASAGEIAVDNTKLTATVSSFHAKNIYVVALFILLSGSHK